MCLCVLCVPLYFRVCLCVFVRLGGFVSGVRLCVCVCLCVLLCVYNLCVFGFVVLCNFCVCVCLYVCVFVC